MASSLAAQLPRQLSSLHASTSGRVPLAFSALADCRSAPAMQSRQCRRQQSQHRQQPAVAAAAAPARGGGTGSSRSGGRSSSGGSSSSSRPKPAVRSARPPRPPPHRPPPAAPPATPPPRQQQQLPDLPAADFARVRTSAFVGSSVDLRGCPPQTHPEFAIIGRSNVGKSSLINMLTQNARLAKVSKEPGMTKTINHFLINDSWYLVDLPGYGYAKTAGKAERGGWLDFTKEYFLKREVLVAVMLLVDASIPPQRIDLDCAAWLAESMVPFAVVFTKCDARKKGGPTPAANVRAFKSELLKDYEELPACFETSAQLGLGRSEVLRHLASMRALDREEGGEFL